MMLPNPLPECGIRDTLATCRRTSMPLFCSNATRPDQGQDWYTHSVFQRRGISSKHLVVLIIICWKRTESPTETTRFGRLDQFGSNGDRIRFVQPLLDVGGRRCGRRIRGFWAVARNPLGPTLAARPLAVGPPFRLHSFCGARAGVVPWLPNFPQPKPPKG